jgi:hypothetical protein
MSSVLSDSPSIDSDSESLNSDDEIESPAFYSSMAALTHLQSFSNAIQDYFANEDSSLQELECDVFETGLSSLSDYDTVLTAASEACGLMFLLNF